MKPNKKENVKSKWKILWVVHLGCFVLLPLLLLYIMTLFVDPTQPPESMEYGDLIVNIGIVLVIGVIIGTLNFLVQLIRILMP